MAPGDQGRRTAQPHLPQVSVRVSVRRAGRPDVRRLVTPVLAGRHATRHGLGSCASGFLGRVTHEKAQVRSRACGPRPSGQPKPAKREPHHLLGPPFLPLHAGSIACALHHKIFSALHLPLLLAAPLPHLFIVSLSPAGLLPAGLGLPGPARRAGPIIVSAARLRRSRARRRPPARPHRSGFARAGLGSAHLVAPATGRHVPARSRLARTVPALGRFPLGKRESPGQGIGGPFRSAGRPASVFCAGAAGNRPCVAPCHPWWGRLRRCGLAPTWHWTLSTYTHLQA